LPQSESARLARLRSARDHPKLQTVVAICRWGVQSWVPMPEEPVLLFVLAGRRFGDEWRFVFRVGLDRRTGRG
jgi:hypothetical protein